MTTINDYTSRTEKVNGQWVTKIFKFNMEINSSKFVKGSFKTASRHARSLIKDYQQKSKDIKKHVRANTIILEQKGWFPIEDIRIEDEGIFISVADMVFFYDGDVRKLANMSENWQDFVAQCNQIK